MGKKYQEITPEQMSFIASQKLFFCASAAPEGRVNVSPKGGDSLRVLGPNRVIWLNLTGSGNETAAHVLENPRMTLMFCAFEGSPKILRLYGNATAIGPGDPEWEELYSMFGSQLGARQIFDLAIDLVQTSCGFGVPYFDYAGERDKLKQWAEEKGEQGVRDYWRQKNAASLDGKDTGIGRYTGSGDGDAS
jgi:hypothetical protein